MRPAAIAAAAHAFAPRTTVPPAAASPYARSTREARDVRDVRDVRDLRDVRDVRRDRYAYERRELRAPDPRHHHAPQPDYTQVLIRRRVLFVSITLPNTSKRVRLNIFITCIYFLLRYRLQN